MERMEVGLQSFEEAKICAPLRIGYSKIFCEHFLSTDNIHSRRCREQLAGIKGTSQLYAGIGAPGRLLDDYQLGGSHIIRAACLARSRAIDETEIAS